MVNLTRNSYTVLFFFIIIFSSSVLFSQDTENYTTETLSLSYISPADLIESLLLEKSSSEGHELKIHNSIIYIRFNESNNQVLLNGLQDQITEAKELIKFFDVPPRQIIIEVKIVEIDDQKLDEIGLDWQNLLDRTRFGISYDTDHSKTEQETKYDGDQSSYDRDDKTTRSTSRLSVQLGTFTAGDLINIIRETDAGKIINIPHIVTTNNRTGKILDGHKITYVTRYSSYTNLFETQELTAGLSLSVTPSIGASGYLKLDVIAKLTSLGQIISGSPSESGQILENTIIVKDQESFLLGGFKQTETRKVRRKVPILGTILPFLFSKHIDIEINKNILLILTPRIIDLNTTEIPKF